MSNEKDPKPMKKTSAVPLRKETVRVTLKATPEDSKAKAPAPPAAPQPPAPAPTIPLKTAGSGIATPTPAPTVKLQTGTPGTGAPAPAPTIKLNTPGSSAPSSAALTGGTASSSQPLPKATVQLQKTQPMGAPAAAPSQAATIHTAEDDDSKSTKGEGMTAALSVIALIAAIIVLGIQLTTANIWLEGEWGRLFE